MRIRIAGKEEIDLAQVTEDHIVIQVWTDHFDVEHISHAVPHSDGHIKDGWAMTSMNGVSGHDKISLHRGVNTASHSFKELLERASWTSVELYAFETLDAYTMWVYNNLPIFRTKE